MNTFAIILAGLACLVVGCLLIQPVRREYLRRNPSLLNPDRAHELCTTFHLAASDQRCGKSPVYAKEFFLEIRNRYIPGQWLSAKREEIDKDLGLYFYKCDEWTTSASDGDFQNCYYDLNGDRSYLITITFRRLYSSKEVLTFPSDQIWSIEDDFERHTVADSN